MNIVTPPLKFYRISAIFCLIIFALKMLTIFYASSRDISLGYPYDGLVYDPFHRFTDWLIPLAFSKLANPYDTTNVLYSQLPPAPYSILTFWILQLSKYLGSTYYVFYGFLIITLGVNFLIFNEILKKLDSQQKFLIFFSLIVTSYPLYLEIDRGNVEIMGIAAITLFIYNEIMSGKKIISCLILSFLVALKPSWGLFGLLLFAYPARFFVISVLFISFIYLYPIIFLNSDLNYLSVLIKKTIPYIDTVTTFCTNLTCGIRVFGISTKNLEIPVTIIGIISALLLTMYFKYSKKVSNPAQKVFFIFTSVLLISVLINNPSPDYRAVIFLPLYAYFFSRFDADFLINKEYIILILVVTYVLTSSFINIPIINTIPYYTVLRVLGVVILSLVFIYLTIIKIRKSSNDKN